MQLLDGIGINEDDRKHRRLCSSVAPRVIGPPLNENISGPKQYLPSVYERIDAPGNDDNVVCGSRFMKSGMPYIFEVPLITGGSRVECARN
jgi:hypothetical protein